MQNRFKNLGIFYFAFGALGLVMAGLLFAVKSGWLLLPAKMSIFSSAHGYVSVIALIFAIEAIPAIVTGLALLKGILWARMSAMALGFVNLFIIPLGTALGIYTLWILINDTSLSESSSETVDEKMLPRVFPPYR